MPFSFAKLRSTVVRAARPRTRSTELHAERREIRVVVADDHTLFREAIRQLLETQADLRVVGEACDAAQAAELGRTLQPDVLLLDVRMPGASGLEALKEISATAPTVRTVLLAAEVSGADVLDALQRGARGVVLKHAAPEQLFKSIRTVMAGEYWVTRTAVGGLIGRMRERHGIPVAASVAPSGLTPRELEIVMAAAAGRSNAEIAAQLAISPKTVKHHFTNIFQKVGVSSRLELVVFAMQHSFDPERFH